MLFDIHRVWGYAAIVANFLAGVVHAGRVEVAAVPRPVAVVADDHRRGDDADPGVPRRAARERASTTSRRASTCSTASSSFITIGLLYSYRYVWRARGWMELAYGLGGLFIMGLGIRAVLQVVA